MKRPAGDNYYSTSCNSCNDGGGDDGVSVVREMTRRRPRWRSRRKTNETTTRAISIVTMKSIAWLAMMMVIMMRSGRIGRINLVTDAFQVETLTTSRMSRSAFAARQQQHRLTTSSTAPSPYLYQRKNHARSDSVSHLLRRRSHRPQRPLCMISNGDGDDGNEDGGERQRGKRVIVVGGGVGGLAVASRIAAAAAAAAASQSRQDDNISVSGVDITILEKNPQIGGRCGSFWVEAPTTMTVEKNSNNNKSNNSIGMYRHERGPSLLLLPHVYKQIFEETTMMDIMADIDTGTSRRRDASYYGLDMVQCVPAYQVVFDDGDRIEVGFPTQQVESTTTTIATREASSRTKMDSYEEDGARKWDDYLRITQAYLDCGLPNFIEERLDLISFPNFVWEGVIRDFAKAWPLQPHSDLLDSLFTSTKLKALASFQDLYVGLEPYRNNELLGGGVLRSTAPAVFGLLAAIELHPTNKKAGVFAPIGGFQAVTNSLENLASDLGIDIQCNTTVVGINESGVYTKETSSQDSTCEFLPADLVVVNADLPYAKESLLIKDNDNDIEPNQQESDDSCLEEKFDWDDTFSFSSGVISFHWSIAGKVLEDLNTHNVFLSAGSPSDAIASWDELRYSNDEIGGRKTSDDDMNNDIPFNFYVHRPTVCDRSAAPEGCDSIMVLVPCKTLLRDEECATLPRVEAMKIYKDQFSEDFISATRQAVLGRMKCVDSLQDFDKHIIDEVVDTPATWAEQFHLAAGTPFALSHGFAQLSLTRPGPSSSGMSNVLYCGASTRPGNGVPLVLIGAKQVAQKAVAKLFKR